jgi:pimeloyl-ACP methyl ester carboxylesterase
MAISKKIRMQHVEYQGKKVAYTFSKKNAAQTIILLHGFCEDSRMWDDWLKLLPDDHNYLRIDLPGFGQSELHDNLTVESLADAVRAVLEGEGIQKCLLTGHSMGGYVSLAFAEKYGGMLTGLCLFHSQAHADTEEKKTARLKSVEFVERNGHILYVRQLIPKLFAYDYSKGYPSEVNRLIFHASKYDPAGIIAALHAMRQRPDRQSVLENIDCPVLFFIGKKDAAVPLENSLEQTHLPNISDIQIYPNVGHMGMFEAPRKTAKAFRSFVKRIGGLED